MRHYLAPSMFLGLFAIGCAEPPKAPEAPTLSLTNCAEERPSQDVTAWSCGPLTAVETLIIDASPDDIAMAFDGFAANFGGKTPKRIDSLYHTGERRHSAMRLEGLTESGAPQEAQMVAVSIGSGYRLVTCATKDLQTPCGPIISALVLELPHAPSSAEAGPLLPGASATRFSSGTANGL